MSRGNFLAELIDAIAEMDAAGDAADAAAYDAQRSAYAHLVEAKKVWRLALNLFENKSEELQPTIAKARAVIDARKAVRSSPDPMVEIGDKSGMYLVIDARKVGE